MQQIGGSLILGELQACEDGVARGWVEQGKCGPCTVIVRLDGVPAGAGISMAANPLSAPNAGRRAFQVELDASRAARGGMVTAERVSGEIRSTLAGQIVLAPDGEDAGCAALLENGTFSFKKRAGLRVSGWIAVQNRGQAPVLSVMVAGRCVSASGPAAFSPDAWKAGGQLASGYEITFPPTAGADQDFEAVLCDEASGREYWRGRFDASDSLREDIIQITACGACRGGNKPPELLHERCEDFVSEIETADEASLNSETAALALRLVSWIRDMRNPETAFAAAMRLKPAALMRLLPGPFVETLGSVICSLPRAALDSAQRQLDAKFASSPASRPGSLLDVLAQTRLTGLDDGGERIIRSLQAMNYGQTALNWIWEAVSDSGCAPASTADLRQAIEFEIISRNVPFLNGYELTAARPA